MNILSMPVVAARSCEAVVEQFADVVLELLVEPEPPKTEAISRFLDECSYLGGRTIDNNIEPDFIKTGPKALPS